MSTINFNGVAGTEYAATAGYQILGGLLHHSTDGLGVKNPGGSTSVELIEDTLVTGNQRYTSVIDFAGVNYWSRVGLCFVNTSRTGVKVFIYQDAGRLVIMEQTAGADGAEIANVGVTVSGSGTTTLDVDFNATTGAIACLVNGVQVLTGTFTGDKSNLRSGIHAESDGSGGASTRSFTSPFSASATINTYPATVRSGQTGIAYTTTGLTSVTGITVGTLAATSLSDTSGDGTHALPALTDTVAHQLYGSKTVTITGVGGAPTTTTSFLPPTGWNYVTLSGTLNTSNTGGLYNFSPAAVVGDQIVYETANITYDAQGNITSDFTGTQTAWHIQASTGTARSYSIITGTTPGVTFNITGLSTTASRGNIVGVSGGVNKLITGLSATTSQGIVSAVSGGVRYIITGIQSLMSGGNITSPNGKFSTQQVIGMFKSLLNTPKTIFKKN